MQNAHSILAELVPAAERRRRASFRRLPQALQLLRLWWLLLLLLLLLPLLDLAHHEPLGVHQLKAESVTNLHAVGLGKKAPALHTTCIVSPCKQ